MRAIPIDTGCARTRARKATTKSIPRDLLVWQAGADWRRKLEPLLPPGLKRMLQRRFQEHPPAEAYVDSWCWVEPAGLRRRLEEAADTLAVSLAGFRCRGYHSCRPRNPDSYIEHGILALDPDRHAAALWKLITTDERLRHCRDATRFAQLRTEFIGGIDEGRTFLALDYRLVENDSAGHYLIWGSESWSAVLGRLGGDAACDVLTRIGVPTVFIVDFPLSSVPTSDHRALAKDFLEVWAYHLARPLRQVPIRDFTFTFQHDIPPTWITGHFHPAIVPYPPGLGTGTYQNPEQRCKSCTP